MVAAARELPPSGYALEVDGRFKAEFATRDGARAGAEELKKRFPMLQVRIYDAETKAREEVELPRGAVRIEHVTPGAHAYGRKPGVARCHHDR